MIEETRWHETLRLYAAQADANLLVQTCLALKTKPALLLAADIDKEVLQLKPALREALANETKKMVVRLRREPLVVSQDEARSVFDLDENWRPLQYVQNQFERRGEVVMDHATGLMWQQAGSKKDLTYQAALEYVVQLNAQRFAGYADWRLPTIAELCSLLEPEKQANDLYINPIFDAEQWWCWSADRLPEKEARSAGPAWHILFRNGRVRWDDLDGKGFVRVVRL